MKHFSRALVWLTVSEIIFNLAGYVIHSALGRILGPEDYGRFGLVVTLTTMLIVLIGNGVPTAMSKYIAEVFDDHPERVKTIKYAALKLQLLIVLPTAFLFYFISPWVAGTLLCDASLTPLFQISAFIIPMFAAASFYFYYYTGLHYFRLQATLKSLRALARIIFIIGFAYLWGVEGAVSGYIAAPLTIFLIASLYDIFKVNPLLPASDKNFTFNTRDLFQYAWPFTLFLIFYELVLTADLYFVKALLGSDYLTGIYNAAITVGRIPYYLFYALTIILLPAIAKSTMAKTKEETSILITKTLTLFSVILLPMVALMALYRVPIIEFFYSARYLEAVPAYTVFVFGAGFLTVFYVLSFALHGAGKVFIPLYTSLFGVLLLALLNWQWIPPYGLVGAAAAVTVVSFCMMIASLIAIKNIFKVSLLPKTFFLALFSTVFIAAIASIMPTSVYLFIPQSAVLFGLHLFFLFSQGVLRLEDLLPKKQKKGLS